MALELLARFIIGGCILLVAVEGLIVVSDRDVSWLPLRFKWSAAWYTLRLTLIVATLALCILTLGVR